MHLIYVGVLMVRNLKLAYCISDTFCATIADCGINYHRLLLRL